MNFKVQLEAWRGERRARRLRRVALVVFAAIGATMAWARFQPARATVAERPEDLCRRINLPQSAVPKLAFAREGESVALKASAEPRGLVYPDAQVDYWSAAAEAASADPRDQVHYVQPELSVTRFREERIDGHYEGRLVLAVESAAARVCEGVTLRVRRALRAGGLRGLNDLRVASLELRFRYSERLETATRFLDGGRAIEINYRSERSLRNDLPFLDVRYEARAASGSSAAALISVGGRLKRLMD